MTLVKASWFLFYLFLSIGATIFVLSSLNDFMEGKTYYNSAYEQVTLNDIPTLTICWPLTDYVPVLYYTKDFTIENEANQRKKQESS